MLYREAAVRISQTIFMLSRELNQSTCDMLQYQKEGKVNEEEAGTFIHRVQVVLEILYTELLNPIYADHPDLAPGPCKCESDKGNPPD